MNKFITKKRCCFKLAMSIIFIFSLFISTLFLTSCYAGSCSGYNYRDNENKDNGSVFVDNNNQVISRTYTIYKETSDYKPKGEINEPLIASRLTIDLRDWLSADFNGDIRLEAKVDLAYSKDFTTPSPTFTFLYYSQNNTNTKYLLGQNIVTVLNKEKRTYYFTLDLHLEGNIIYGARACNYDMGNDGNNILGMYLDYRTYSLNNYFVTITKL